MKPETGLKLSRKTKIITIIIATTIIYILMGTSYKYGNHMGNLHGYKNALGTEGICEKIDKIMDGDYCQLNTESTYKHYLSCTWGEYIVYGEREYKSMNLDPRMIIMQCKRTHQEVIQ